MRVLFLIQGWEVAASRYRVLQYIPYLKSRGVEATVSLYPRTLEKTLNSSEHSPGMTWCFSRGRDSISRAWDG